MFEFLWDPALGVGTQVLLVSCLLLAFGFEFVNGFHDTANAVATVIYTNSLKPKTAVILSGISNFLGVFFGGISVALGIIKLLPVELLVSAGVGKGLAMVLALLIAAILWNLGTWYLGLPASSSHTLIGAILGVGLAHSLLPGHTFGEGVNWVKAGEVGLALLVSPVIGFCLAGLLLLLVRRYSRDASMLAPPPNGTPPPLGTRALLVATCTGVSLAHGSNDGQKGVGLVMLILMGLLPASFALNMDAKPAILTDALTATTQLEQTLQQHGDTASIAERTRTIEHLQDVRAKLQAHASVSDIPRKQRFIIRSSVLRADQHIEQLIKAGALGLTTSESKDLKVARQRLRAITDYAPLWVLFAIALSLGIGTMVGWKRIVVTIGERIGKTHLTYAQGACAELVAASTIGLSAWIGMPVSTTHVLSSGVAGTMVAHRSGLRGPTVRNIALAWLLTLPVSMLLSGSLFLALCYAFA